VTSENDRINTFLSRTETEGAVPRRVPKLCRHKSSGRAYVTDPASGKPVYLGRWGTPEADEAYERWRTQFLARTGDLPRTAATGRATVDQVLAAYLEHAREWYKKRGRATSHLWVVQMVVTRVRQLLGPDALAEEVRGRDVEALQRSMIAEDLARSTINQVCRKWAAIWRWGVSKDMVSDEAAGRIRSVQPVPKGRLGVRESRKVKPVEEERVERTLPCCSATVRALVLLQRHAGMRPGEACTLTAAEVDRSTDPWLYRPSSWKTEHKSTDEDDVREIWFGPECRQVLGPLLEACTDPDTPLFRTRRGKPFREQAYRAAIHEAARKAGVRPWNPNQLRHAAGTEARARYGPEGARTRLGHKSIRVTEEYAITDRDLARKIAEEMG
jgi:integrase